MSAEVDLVRDYDTSRDLSFVNCHSLAETGGDLIKMAGTKNRVGDHSPIVPICAMQGNGLQIFPAMLVKCPLASAGAW